jgi:agmatinase
MDEETLVDWGGLKIHTREPLVPGTDPEQAMARIEAAAAAVLEAGKFLLALGGDHAVSIGLIKAAARAYPDVGVLQVDAHADLRGEWNGSPYNHACVMRRVMADFGLPAVQVGIRSFSPEEAAFMRGNGLKPFFAHRIDPADDGWIGEAVDGLPETVYMTVDLDGLDPSVIPGTGTPEPGGLTYRQLIALIRETGRRRRVVAAAINELVKIAGTQVSEYTAAKIATKIFVHCARARGKADHK